MSSRIYNHERRDNINRKRSQLKSIDKASQVRAIEMDSGEQLTDLRQWEQLPPPFPFEWDNERQEYITF
jgi:hypothetical protein